MGFSNAKVTLSNLLTIPSHPSVTMFSHHFIGSSSVIHLQPEHEKWTRNDDVDPYCIYLHGRKKMLIMIESSMT